MLHYWISFFLSHSLSLSLPLSLSLSLSFSVTLSYSFSVSVSLPLSLSISLSHFESPSLSSCLSLPLSLSLSPSLSPSFSFSFRQSYLNSRQMPSWGNKFLENKENDLAGWRCESYLTWTHFLWSLALWSPYLIIYFHILINFSNILMEHIISRCLIFNSTLSHILLFIFMDYIFVFIKSNFNSAYFSHFFSSFPIFQS